MGDFRQQRWSHGAIAAACSSATSSSTCTASHGPGSRESQFSSGANLMALSTTRGEGSGAVASPPACTESGGFVSGASSSTGGNVYPTGSSEASAASGWEQMARRAGWGPPPSFSTGSAMPSAPWLPPFQSRSSWGRATMQPPPTFTNSRGIYPTYLPSQHTTPGAGNLGTRQYGRGGGPRGPHWA